MALTLFNDINQKLEQPISDFVDKGVSQLSSYVASPLKTALIIYIVIYGILIIQGMVREPLIDFAVRGMKLAIIVALASNAGTFNEYVKNIFFTALPTEIGNAISGNSASALGSSSFDALISKGWEAGSTIWQQAGWTDPGPALIGIVVIAFAGFGTVVAFGMYIFAKVALAIVLALGPIFIALALFQPTRRFTESWLGALANYVVLQVLVVTVLSLVINMVDSFAKQYGSNSDVILVALSYVVIFILVAWIAFQLPTIASSIAGGGAALAGQALQSAAQAPVTAARAIATKGASLASDGMKAAGAARNRNLMQAAANAGASARR